MNIEDTKLAATCFTQITDLQKIVSGKTTQPHAAQVLRAAEAELLVAEALVTSYRESVDRAKEKLTYGEVAALMPSWSSSDSQPCA